MYIPAFNKVEEPERIRTFVRANGFAAVIGGTPQAAMHTPVLLESAASGERLVGHVARANPHWESILCGEEVLCVFMGPNAYISPTMYVTGPAVPTWNYAAVHIRGRPKVESDPKFVRKVLEDTVDQYESQRPVPWSMDFGTDYAGKMMRAVVAFSVEITRIEARFKFGQNRPAEDQESMLRALKASTGGQEQALASLIEASRKKPGS